MVGRGGVGAGITVLGYFNVTIINFVVIDYLFMSCVLWVGCCCCYCVVV